jgi:hypothetical protein
VLYNIIDRIIDDDELKRIRKEAVVVRFNLLS